MNMKRLTAAMTGLMMTALACAMMTPQGEEADYSRIPPDPVEVERQLLAFPMSLTEAIDIAQEVVGGYAISAMIRMDRDIPVVEVVAFAEGRKQVLVIDASAGVVAERRDVPRFPGEPVTGNWIERESGLKYYELKVGEGAQPTGDDATVKMEFTAWFVDGRKLDSSADRGTPITTQVNRLLKGWSEGIRDMREGGKRKLIIPADLAFGEAGNPPMIPPKATMIIDLELVEVVDYGRIPEVLPGWPVEGEGVRKESGLVYYDVLEGEGEEAASASSTVRVHYTGYLNDGTEFDSSTRRGQPKETHLSEDLPGWAEGIAGMRVGGKRKLVIPAELAYGEQGSFRIPGKATLIYDIELVEIVAEEAGEAEKDGEPQTEPSDEHDT